MPLYRIKDIYANPAEKYFDGHDITSFDVHAMEDGEQKKVGSVKNLLVDESGRFRYFAVNTGIWIFGKTVLLPVGQVRVDYENARLYAPRLTKEQVEALPKYDDDMVIDDPYETIVYDAYASASVEQSAAVEQSVPVESRAAPNLKTRPQLRAKPAKASSEGDRYDQSPDLYSLPKDDDRIRLYEERLVAEKHREKVGEVKISKSIETSTDEVSVPVQKERIVIEVTTPISAAAAAGATDFKETEVTHMDLHEEVATARKDVTLRETVKVRKEVEQETKTLSDTVRREKLNVEASDSADVEMRDR